MSPATLSRLKQSDDSIAATIEAGRAEFHAQLMLDLNPEVPEGMSIQQGIAVMRAKQLRAMFLLKTRFGYVEGVELGSAASTLNVQINIPASVDADNFVRIVAEQKADE